MWRAPAGADLLDDIPESGDEYLQCAGTSEALTVELRTVGDGGLPHQYVLGKSASTPTREPDVVIRWDDGRHRTTVHAHESFTADEAADVFYAYFLTDTVPDHYTARELFLKN